jgi:hypothetical protein
VGPLVAGAGPERDDKLGRNVAHGGLEPRAVGDARGGVYLEMTFTMRLWPTEPGQIHGIWPTEPRQIHGIWPTKPRQMHGHRRYLFLVPTAQADESLYPRHQILVVHAQFCEPIKRPGWLELLQPMSSH